MLAAWLNDDDDDDGDDDEYIYVCVCVCVSVCVHIYQPKVIYIGNKMEFKSHWVPH